MQMKTESRILRFNLKGNYYVKEIIYRNTLFGKLRVHKMIMACNTKGCLIGSPKLAKMLTKTYGVNEFHQSNIGAVHSVCRIGFNKNEQAWYGWSNTYIAKFTVGTAVEKGDITYKPVNREEYIQSIVDEYQRQGYNNIHIVANEEDKTLEIDYQIIRRGVGTLLSSVKPLDVKYGRGAWVAETLEDAKQMAIDFSDNINE